DRVNVSAIFDWFGEDWEPQYGNDQFPGNDKQQAALGFISDYVDPELASYLKSGRYEVGYLDYDWSLNDQG
ncbi:MAG: DUF547 domain-containing protein, partial [Elainellaceae cyanobacterium]